jgi:hypothetical protein
LTIPYQPFLISTFKTGLYTELEPWMSPVDAFQSILDGYVRHGVLSKRSGIQYFGDFVNATTTSITSITVSDPAIVQVASAAGISNGDWFQIRDATGAVEANNNTYMVSNLTGNFFDIVDVYGNNVDSSSWGIYAGGGLYFPVPKLPIMGIKTFIDTDGVRQLLIFNTRRAAIYNTSTNVFDPIDAADVLNGNESSFINSAAFGKTGAFGTSTFYFTNFTGNTGINYSPMRFFTTGNTTTSFIPDTRPTTTSVYVNAAHYIFTMRNRLLLLDTVEGTISGSGGTHFPQRLRWSVANNPTASGSNWDEITPGNGGFVDCPTSEVVVSATQLKDIIIVDFTSSVWAIRPTSDPALPFRWDKLNSFRASDAPYATIGHDQYRIAFGKRGITASDGSVETPRIDNKIDKFIINEVNTSQMVRMYSERNYNERRSWTLYPAAVDDVKTDSENSPTTSNRALIRTEEEQAWSIYRVALKDVDPDNGVNFSTLGYGEVEFDLAFDDFDGPEDSQAPDYAFNQFGDETFGSFFQQADSEIFIGGDQNGRVYFLEKDGDDMGEEIGFEVISAAWNPFKDKGLQSQLGYIDFYVDADTDTQFQVEFFADDIDEPYATQNLDCLPDLGFLADIQGISQANPCVVTAASHGLSTGDEIYIYNLDGMDELSGGPYTVTVIDEDEFSLDDIDSTAYTAYIGSGTIVEREFENTKCWKRAYAGGKGYQHFIKITNSGTDDVLRFNAFMPWFCPAGRMIG